MDHGLPATFDALHVPLNIYAYIYEKSPDAADKQRSGFWRLPGSIFEESASNLR